MCRNLDNFIHTKREANAHARQGAEMIHEKGRYDSFWGTRRPVFDAVGHLKFDFDA
jgi:hypothetical protein